MFRSQLERLTHPAFLGFYLAAPFILLQIRDERAYPFILPIIAVVAFIAWLLSLRRMLAISGTPTARIASAAQGYVELVGRAMPHPGGALRSRFSQLPCVWYQYFIDEGPQEGKRERIRNGRTQKRI